MTSENKGKKVIVIGGGPGGYVAAIRAAQLGANVTVIEKERLGGTCLNVGCIPTKVLLHTEEIFTELKGAKEFGINFSGSIEIDFKALQNRKNSIVNKLVNGVRSLLIANKISLIEGEASFIDKNNIKVIKKDKAIEHIIADSIIIAAGSEPFIPPIKGSELDGVIDSTAALSLDKVPEKIVIIGGGVIGTEFANVFNSLGAKVTIVEMLPYILPPIDREIGNIIKAKMMNSGIKIYNNAKVIAIEKAVYGKNPSSGLKVLGEIDGEILEFEGDKVLIAVGRRAATKNLNLEALGVKLNRGCIEVDEKMRTNIEEIYAIGDCTGKNMLAHVASEQGIVAAENIMGLNRKMDYKTVPACVYTKPEIASVGITEEQAKERGVDYKVGKFPLLANGKTLIMGEEEGTMFKVIADKKYGEVLGVHLIGPRATDLITEGALALRLESTLEEIATTIHAHPTVGEAMKEAVLAADNIAIHIPNKK